MVLLVVVVPALLMAFALAMEIVEDKLVGRGREVGRAATRTDRPGDPDFTGDDTSAPASSLPRDR